MSSKRILASFRTIRPTYAVSCRSPIQIFEGVTAVVVYPMNALINSQHDEFNRYKKNYEEGTGKAFPITFGQYTGQEDEDIRAKLRDDQSPVGSLSFATIGEAVFKALSLPFLEFANRNEETPLVPIRRKYEECLQEYILYRAVADLRRSWRVVLPNLEQCALLSVEYADMDEIAATDEFWNASPLLGSLEYSDRKELLCTILDFFRLEYAIHSENFLTQSRIKENEKQFREMLRPPWTLDRNEALREPYYIRYEPLNKNARLYSKSMGPASSLGKFVKQYVRQRKLDIDLKKGGYRNVILHFYYEPRIWVFCDGTPHDESAVKADDEAKRQAIIAKGDEVRVFHYKDDLAGKVSARPDIFRRVR